MPTVNLWATDGYVGTPDGKSVYIWGFTDKEGGAAQLPGPAIIVKQQPYLMPTVVTVNLTNKLAEPVSLVFPGQGEVRVNGQPAQPQYQGDKLVSFINHALPGETITYQVTLTGPGTFLYESGTYPHRQVQMGLYGAMIVRPPDYLGLHPEKQTAYGRNTGTEFDREYLLVLGEIDPGLHQSVEHGLPYDTGEFNPRYRTINGKCWNGTMFGDGHLPVRPYGSMIMMEPGEKVLLRCAGVVESHSLHPHGNHARVVGLDGKLLQNRDISGTTDLSFKRFTILTGPGQTCDLIYTWTGPGYEPDTNPIPTRLPQIRKMALAPTGLTMWSGSPYLGVKGELPGEIESWNQIGEYHFMLNSHGVPGITGQGAFPGGMPAMIAVYPAGTLEPHHGMLPTESHTP